MLSEAKHLVSAKGSVHFREEGVVGFGVVFFAEAVEDEIPMGIGGEFPDVDDADIVDAAVAVLQ